MVSVVVNLLGSTVVYMVAAFDFVEHPVDPAVVHSCTHFMLLHGEK